jgi:Uma2 family endonuclease
MDSGLLATLIESVHGEGVRLEYVAGMPYWEMMPGVRHHDALMSIWSRLTNERKGSVDCGCFPYAELTLGFPDGSVKTPDLSIFCKRPTEREGLVHMIPEAVVEIVSPGYERKDLEIGPTFYLAQGVKDIIVFDPRSNLITHFRRDGVKSSTAPDVFELECGCIVPISPVD